MTELCKFVIEKALSNNKSNIKPHAEEILIELFEKTYKDDVIRMVTTCISHKN